MANHASTRTTQLYDRRHEELSLEWPMPSAIWRLFGPPVTVGEVLRRMK